MDEIKVILADGTELYFPLGTDDAIIDAKVKEVVSGQSQDPVATERREPIGLGAQAALGATQAGFDALGGESTRAQKANEIFASTLKGDQSVSEGVTQAYGQGFASLGDLIGKGVGLIGEGVSSMTPDVIEDEVINQLGIFFDQPLMQAGKEAIAAGGEAWDQFSQENPRAARNIEAVVNISGATGLGGLGKQSAGRYARTYEPTKAREARQLIEGGESTATRNVTAPYRLEQVEGAEPTIVSERGPLPKPEVPTRAVKNPTQQAAIKQGFDEGLVAMIREASPADRRNMLRSLEIMKDATEDKRFSMTNRTTDIAGESILDRYKLIRDVNEQAGAGIDDYAEKNLKGRAVDFAEPVQNFEESLQKLGVKFNDDLTLDFELSAIEDVAPAERILNQIVKRMRAPRQVTAYDVHNLKRFIDEQVSYGKATEGLTGRTINVIKNLRRELDGILDNKFPEYDKLNTTYAETIQAMDDFSTAIGRTIDPDSPSAATAIGTSLRGLGSNRQTRGRLVDSVSELNSLGNRYGSFDDDVITQTAFTIDLDRIFGTKADTSLSGVLGEAAATMPTSTGQFVGAAARAAGNKLRGVNQEKQFEAMRNLLKSFEPSN
jgi:hypothetical protein